MTPLPDDLERAFDQFLTYLIQCQFLCSDVIGPYIGRISYGFPEVKSILAYEMFDYNVHAGMLRKPGDLERRRHRRLRGRRRRGRRRGLQRGVKTASRARSSAT